MPAPTFSRPPASRLPYTVHAVPGSRDVGPSYAYTTGLSLATGSGTELVVVDLGMFQASRLLHTVAEQLIDRTLALPRDLGRPLGGPVGMPPFTLHPVHPAWHTLFPQATLRQRPLPAHTLGFAQVVLSSEADGSALQSSVNLAAAPPAPQRQRTLADLVSELALNQPEQPENLRLRGPLLKATEVLAAVLTWSLAHRARLSAEQDARHEDGQTAGIGRLIRTVREENAAQDALAALNPDDLQHLLDHLHTGRQP